MNRIDVLIASVDIASISLERSWTVLVEPAESNILERPYTRVDGGGLQ